MAAFKEAEVGVTDTRKTTPGLRALEKYAVRVGGDASHRSDLASGVLLKDNHIALVGSVREAVRRARANASHVLRVVVEVDNLAQLDEALEAGAEGILLDNFQVRDMAEAVKRVRERRSPVVIEASGGVTLDRMHDISKTGVDRGLDRIRSRTPRARSIFRARSGRPTARANATRRGVMGGGRWGWAAALAIAAGAGGCDEGGAPTRGFHSRQLVSTRDPTLSLVSFQLEIVTAETDDGPRSFYGTDPDVAYYLTGDEPARTYWKVNLTSGEVTELGERITSWTDPPPAERFDCRSEGNASGVSTLYVIDSTTGQDIAAIDRLIGVFTCPRYPDRYMAVVRLDENDVGRLWSRSVRPARARGAGPRDRCGAQQQLVRRARPDEVADDGAGDGRARAGGARDLADRPRPADDRGGDFACDGGRDLGARRNAVGCPPVGWPGARKRRDPPSGRRESMVRLHQLMNNDDEVMFAGPLAHPHGPRPASWRC